uniref:Homing endonuclease n=1 Tax=viral metagenome TaxID=1070528 RepID=A0A6M3L5I0_9ZZZZ
MRKTEILAYTAGIIDGEGHITILNKPDCRSRKVQVAVTNTNEWLCQWLKMQFGGRVYTWKPYQKHWKPAYRWILEFNKATDFLQLVLPYLNLKRAHAEIAIAYQERRVMGKRTDNQKALDEADRILIAKLNKRGI